MTAIILHLYYQDLWEEFKSKIIPLLNENVHLYITVNQYSDYVLDMQSIAKNVFIVKNKGTDFGPFVYIWNKIKDKSYKYVIKLHGKKSIISTRKGYGDFWRNTLVDSIISSPEKLQSIIYAMENYPNIFMAGSKKHFQTRISEPESHCNRLDALNSIKKICKYVKSDMHGCFFSGSMFLTTTNYLNLFFSDCNLDELYNEFEEYYASDGSLLSHGLERVIGYAVETHNGNFLLLE